MAPSHVSPLPLPNGWPGRVRSAVVHAISLATASMTSARGWAADSWNPHLRQGMWGTGSLWREGRWMPATPMTRDTWGLAPQATVPSNRRAALPAAWLTDALERLASGWKQAGIAELLPGKRPESAAA
jgi:hypothetical protein